MIRVSFNGGELSPGVRCRPDLEIYHRGCSRIENFDVSQMGGVRRRRGMRGLLEALPGSRLYPYTYSVTLSYLVEVAPSACRIISPEGKVVQELRSPWNTAEIAELRVRQINKHLLLTCSTQPVMSISTDDAQTWTMEPWSFKSPPLRHSGMRDTSVRIERVGDYYKVEFDEEEKDQAYFLGDKLSIEVTVPTQTVYASRSSWLDAPGQVRYDTLTTTSKVTKGKIAYRSEGSYYVLFECVKDFDGAKDLNAGRTSFEDYPDFFVKGAAYGNVVTCKGTWKFSCCGTWCGEIAIERRYPDEIGWTFVASSFSQYNAYSNLQPTGDESAEECYLRLRIYRVQAAWYNIGDANTLQLVVSPYRKRVLLEAQGGGDGNNPVRNFIVPTDEENMLVFREGEKYTFPDIKLQTDGASFMTLGGGSAYRLGSMLYVTLNEPVDYDAIPDSSWAMLFMFHFDGSVLTYDSPGEYIILSPTGLEISTWTGRFSGGFAGARRSSVDYAWYDTISWREQFSDAVGYNDFARVDHGPYNNLILNRIRLTREGNHNPKAEVHIPAGDTSEYAGFSREYCVHANQTFKVIDKVMESCPDKAESMVWSWGAFSRVYGYPALCDIYQQRLVLASTSDQPQTVWMSKTDDLDNFEASTDDDGAIAVTLSTTTRTPIAWLLSQNARLLLGTSESEWTISGGDGGITAGNARADNSGFVGGASVPALMATDRCVYIERGGSRAYQYGYNYEADAYLSTDLTVFADHILRIGGGVVSGCFVRKPDPRAIFVLREGTVALMTYNTMHNVNAWHRYTTDGRIESAAVLPNGNEADLLFFIVSRPVEIKAGAPLATTRWIEVLAPGNDYVDNGGRDYTSMLVCNAFDTVETASRKRQSAGAAFCFADPVQTEGMEVTGDGLLWARIDHPELPAGWNTLVAWSSCTFEMTPGLRVNGNRGLELLSMSI